MKETEALKWIALNFYRIIIYVIGLILLGLGITFNIKAGLGVSPISSISYSISNIFNGNFGNITMIMYTIFVLAQFGLTKAKIKLILILQLPLSILFTRMLNLFIFIIPDVDRWWLKYIVLMFAIILTGTGAFLTIKTKLIPNPADGLVSALSQTTGKSLGFTKNVFDAMNVLVTVIICIVFNTELYGIGIGTLLAVLGVGRVIAFLNQLGRFKPQYI